MEFAVAVASDTDSWKHVKRAEELGFHSSWFYDPAFESGCVYLYGSRCCEYIVHSIGYRRPDSIQ
ncbi:MAG: hypothetical protein ACNYPE_16015 [Candidatus Azotimanducaceae bacterium WSBS_2022_MAG_OTU7]